MTSHIRASPDSRHFMGEAEVNDSQSPRGENCPGEAFCLFVCCKYQRTMVHTCVVIGCSNRSNQEIKRNFFSIPAVRLTEGERTEELSRQRRLLWISRINRKDFQPSKYSKVCSDHFISGKPSPLYPGETVDWAPSLKLGHPKVTKVARPSKTKAKRQKKQRQQKWKKQQVDAALSLISLFKARPKDEADVKDGDQDPAAEMQTCDTLTQATQTELTITGISFLESELNRLAVENIKLKQELARDVVTEDTFRDDDEKVDLYTGLPCFALLMTLYSFLEPSLSQSHNSSLSKFQKLILVLMRLKLRLPREYLADKFKISPWAASEMFLSTLHVMYVKLKELVHWPTQEERTGSMPMELRKHFGLKVAAIIDCVELFIERPSNLTARTQTWSTSQRHNTIKFLIGVSPQGVVSFISKGYGGRASAKRVLDNCGFLDLLEDGDVVLADRNFVIADTEPHAGCEVKLQAFTKGQNRLSTLKVEKVKKLSGVQEHVARVIGLVRNRYTLLQDAVPVDALRSTDDSTATIDKILTVCGALSNLCPPVVVFD